MRGAVYVAFGEAAMKQAKEAIGEFKKYHDIPVATVSERPIAGAQHLPFSDPGNGARWAKLNINKIVPWDHILYMDADTRVRGDISSGFDIVEDGWDMAIVPSKKQLLSDILWHVVSEEKEYTYESVKNPWPLQLQGGLWWFNKLTTEKFFETWREEWKRWGAADQGALLRALHRCPIRLWVMGRMFNDGELVEHHYGWAVRL